MRQDDTDATKRYFRCPDRVFRMNGAWYFAAREGDQGPFASETVAQQEVSRYLVEKRDLAGFQESREAATQGSGLSLTPLDQRPYDRPERPTLANRKVMI